MHRREIAITIDKNVSGECPVARQDTQVDVIGNDLGIRAVDVGGKSLRDGVMHDIVTVRINRLSVDTEAIKSYIGSVTVESLLVKPARKEGMSKIAKKESLQCLVIMNPLHWSW